MNANSFIVHLLIAAILSFAISIGAWAFLHVFVLVPFLVVSTGVAVLAAAAGYIFGKRLWATAILAIIMRLAVLYLALNP